jgi:hypothetical protein
MRVLYPIFGVCLLAACGLGPGAERVPRGNTREVVRAGWSFGLCAGLCQGTIDVDGASLTFTHAPRPGEGPPAVVRHGELAAAAVVELDELTQALGALEPQYGCPDCADGGASFVDIARGDVVSRSVYEYSLAPAELAGLDAFFAEVRVALSTCAPSARVASVDCAE